MSRHSTNNRRGAKNANLQPDATRAYKSARLYGKLRIPKLCEGCGIEGSRLDGHHEDYAFPFVLIWLCHKCHAAIHNTHMAAFMDDASVLTEDFLRPEMAGSILIVLRHRKFLETNHAQ